MRRVAIAGTLVLLVLGGFLYGLLWITTHSGIYDNVSIVHGVVTLVDPNATFIRPNPYECRAEGIYSAFGDGMEVVLTDQHGSVVSEARTSTLPGASDDCSAGFVLKDVSFDSDTYTITVGEPGTPIYETVTFAADYLEDNREVGIDIGADD